MKLSVELSQKEIRTILVDHLVNTGAIPTAFYTCKMDFDDDLNLKLNLEVHGFDDFEDGK